MTHSQRLRQMANRTGLDGFAEELRAMADEIEAQTPEMPELPRPDTHCFDDDTGKDVWSYSADQMRSYAILALHTQPTNGADVWQPMSTAPSQKTVLLAVRNEYGHVRTVLARHVNRNTEEAGEDDQATEYRESDDTYYVAHGWYESNTEAEINYGITGEFLGWLNAPKWVDIASINDAINKAIETKRNEHDKTR